MVIRPIDFDPLINQNPFNTGDFICGDAFLEDDSDIIVSYNVYYDLGKTVGVAEVCVSTLELRINEISKISFNRFMSYTSPINFN